MQEVGASCEIDKSIHISAYRQYVPFEQHSSAAMLVPIHVKEFKDDRPM